MMRSLFTGVSGLRVHQTKMDVVANNIANVNTVGYKSSRVTFSEVFYQRIQGASAANASTGRAGTNPMQIGLGTSVSTIDNLMTQGASQRTDNATDLMIQGSGFFIVQDNSGSYFTRAGNFTFDADYTLSMNGLKLMGWAAKENQVTKEMEIDKGTLVPMQIGAEMRFVNPVATSLINMTGNLNPNDSTEVTRTMEFFDSVGNKYTTKVLLTYHPSAATNPSTTMTPPSDLYNSYWSFEFDNNGGQGVAIYPNNDQTNPKYVQLSVGQESDTGGTITPGDTTGILRFDQYGNLLGAYSSGTDFTDPDALGKNNEISLTFTVDEDSGLDPTAHIGQNSVEETDATTGSIVLNFAGLTQHVSDVAGVKCLYKDGQSSGTLEDVSIGSDGIVTVRYSNGNTKKVGQIPVANFLNPAGLEKIGNSLYATTANSGPFDGIGEEGSMLGGVLEMSNVDLSAEFTEMITTQRGFQANSRIITTSDDMLQELVNLKR